MENIIKIIPYITLFYMNSLMLNRPISVIPHYSIKIFKTKSQRIHVIMTTGANRILTMQLQLSPETGIWQ